MPLYHTPTLKKRGLRLRKYHTSSKPARELKPSFAAPQGDALGRTNLCAYAFNWQVARAEPRTFPNHTSAKGT
jgi:hypothetical protein